MAAEGVAAEIHEVLVRDEGMADWFPNNEIVKQKPPQPEPSCCVQKGYWDDAILYAPHAHWKDEPTSVFWNGPFCANYSGTQEGTQRAALKATFSVHLFTIPVSLLDSNLILFILGFFFQRLQLPSQLFGLVPKTAEAFSERGQALPSGCRSGCNRGESRRDRCGTAG
jgi:hypothetical protein